MGIKAVNKSNIIRISRELSAIDQYLAKVVTLYGPPPLWDRPQGFETLLQIILEQQVSLASAKACYDKLIVRLGKLTPERLLTLNDAEMKAIGFSRQKTAYARHLAESLVNKNVDLDVLSNKPDSEVKSELMKLKGVGEWTSDIYLLMALLRPDVMPKGDIALHTAWHRLSGEPRPSSDEFLSIAKRWLPYRSVAARLLWHFYLGEKAARAETRV
jgi:DNA-3-methyladenine glycosylase II